MINMVMFQGTSGINDEQLLDQNTYFVLVEFCHEKQIEAEFCSSQHPTFQEMKTSFLKNYPIVQGLISNELQSAIPTQTASKNIRTQEHAEKQSLVVLLDNNKDDTSDEDLSEDETFMKCTDIVRPNFDESSENDEKEDSHEVNPCIGSKKRRIRDEEPVVEDESVNPSPNVHEPIIEQILAQEEEAKVETESLIASQHV